MSDEINVLDHRFGLRDKKIEALEKKFEAHLKDDSEEIRNELARQVDLVGENIEQIAGLHKQVNNNATEVDTRFSILERVLRDVGHSLIATHEVLNLPMLEEENKFLRENLEKLKYYPLHSWRIDPRLLDPDDEVVLDKITGVISIVKGSEKKELYELYLKDKGECYFKKITHPFTEYNNMVHRGIGMKLTPYDTEEKLIEGFIDKLAKLPAQNIVDEHGDNNVVVDGCWISKLSEEYEGMLNK